MRKEGNSELYNYNKFPGQWVPFVWGQGRNLKGFSLVENIKDALWCTAFNQRFSVVQSAWLYRGRLEQRTELPGLSFYKDDQPVGKISRLQDYLLYIVVMVVPILS